MKRWMVEEFEGRRRGWGRDPGGRRERVLVSAWMGSGERGKGEINHREIEKYWEGLT